MGIILYKKYDVFGERLKELRKRKFKTQESFAEAAEVSVETVRNWEQGRVLPEMGTLFKIADILDCDLDYLTGRIDCKTHDVQFIHEQTGLSEKAIKKLRKLAAQSESGGWLDVLSLIIEDVNAEYLLSLIARRVMEYKPRTKASKALTHKELTQDDLWIDLGGQNVLTHRRNILDSLIQSEVANMIPIIAEAYHRKR